jgi:hypothetical protein
MVLQTRIAHKTMKPLGGQHKEKFIVSNRQSPGSAEVRVDL